MFLGLTVGAPLAVVGLAVSSPGVTALGLAMPVLLAQDAVRYVCFARATPGHALFADVVWLLVQSAEAVSLLAIGSRSLALWIYTWAAAALVSVCASMLATQLRPTVADFDAWMRRVRATSWKLLGDFLVTQGAQQIVLFAIPLLAGLSVLGALKAAQVAVGPMSVCMNGAILLALPSIARATASGRTDIAIRRGAAVSGAGFLLAVVYTTAAVALPAHIGAVFFGESWREGARLLPYVALQYSMIALIMGAVAVLRGTQNTGRSLVVRVGVTPINVGLPLAGAWFGGENGLGIALLASATIGAVVWWMAVVGLWRGSRRPPNLTSAPIVS
jgi:O-antigen/teichoic acid export membrane protein